MINLDGRPLVSQPCFGIGTRVLQYESDTFALLLGTAKGSLLPNPILIGDCGIFIVPPGADGTFIVPHGTAKNALIRLICDCAVSEASSSFQRIFQLKYLLTAYYKSRPFIQ